VLLMGCLVLLVVIIGFPMAEFMVMGKVAARVGFWDTTILLVLSAVFGTYLAKHQGNAVLQRIQQCMMEGRLPTLEMVDGLLVFLGGLLFVFPGFISDILGLVLVFPLTRWIVRWLVLAGMQLRVNDPRRPQRPVPPVEPKGHQGLDKGKAVDAEVVE
jgi:UPF0716 protein FxsA